MKNEEVENVVKLKTRDLFKVLTIIRKTGVLKEVKETLLGNKKEKGLSPEELAARQEGVGYDLVILVVENLDKAENEIYELLADISDKTITEVQKQSPIDTFDTLSAIMKDEALAGFLGRALA